MEIAGGMAAQRVVAGSSSSKLMAAVSVVSADYPSSGRGSARRVATGAAAAPIPDWFQHPPQQGVVDRA